MREFQRTLQSQRYCINLSVSWLPKTIWFIRRKRRMIPVTQLRSTQNLSQDTTSLLRDKAVEEATNDDLAAVVMICCLIVVGGFGNLLLLDVYRHNKKKVLSTCFIVGLASTDLTISLVILPTRILLYYVAVPVVVCGAYLSAQYASVSVSIMLFIWLACDRYQSVCLITSPLVTMRHTKYLVGLGFASCIYSFLIAPLHIKGEVILKDGNSSVKIFMREDYPCYITSLLSHPQRTWDPRYIVHFTFAISFLGIIVFVSVLYSLIFKTLRNLDRFRARCKKSKVGTFAITPDMRSGGQTLTPRPCFPEAPDLESNVSRPALPKGLTYDGTVGPRRATLASRIPRHLGNSEDRCTSSAEDKCPHGNVAHLFNSSKHMAVISVDNSSTESSNKVRDAPTERVRPAKAFGPFLLPSDSQSSQGKSPARILNSNSTEREDVTTSSAHKSSKPNSRKAECLEIPSRVHKHSAQIFKIENEISKDSAFEDNAMFVVVRPQTLSLESSDIARGSSSKSKHSENKVDNLSNTSAPFPNDKSSFPSRHWTPNIKTPVSWGFSGTHSNKSLHSESRPCSIQRQIVLGRDCQTLTPTQNNKPSGLGYQCALKGKEGPGAASRIHPSTRSNKAMMPSSFPNKIEQPVKLQDSAHKNTESTTNSSSHTNNRIFCINVRMKDCRIVDRTEVPRPKLGFTHRYCQRQDYVGFKATSLHKGESQAKWNISTRVSLRLFLVTLMYILCWVPFYLIELGIIRYNGSLYNVFYIANVINPLIHITTSEAFRHDAAVRLQHLVNIKSSHVT